MASTESRERIELTAEDRIRAQANRVAAEIGQKLDNLLPERGPSDHSKWNWPSEIGHPCKKFLVHARVDWRERQIMDIDGRYRTEEGKRQEWQMAKDLGDIGFKLDQSQVEVIIPELRIKGKIDGVLRLGFEIPEYPLLKCVPAEEKTLNPNYWNSTRTIEDIKQHRAWWIRGYPSQFNSYLFGLNCPFGIFLMKTFGKRPRILPMFFDADLWRLDSSKIEDVNRHVEAGTYPEPIPYDPQVCEMCDFNHLCQPLKATEMTEISQGDVPLLEFYLELKEQKEKFEDLHKKLIGTGERPGRYHGKNSIVNDIVISTKTQNRKFYKVPDDIKAPFAETKEITITMIERL